MSKNVLEIDVVIGEPPDSVRVAKGVLAKKGDLYSSHPAPEVIKAKNSYDESDVPQDRDKLVAAARGV